MPEYDFLHPLNNLFSSGKVCQDWPSAMYDHMSTLLNISAHSYSKSAVKAFQLIFTKIILKPPKSLSLLYVLQRGYKCFLCHLCDLFTVVLPVALFVSCASVCGLWCRRWLERGWFSTGEWCSVKWSGRLSIPQDELMRTHEPLLWTCVCHHGFKHTVLPIISFGQGHLA